MVSSATTIDTQHASRYLQQLCKHFAHKIPVTYTPEHGECHFAYGTATLDADDAVLRIVVAASDEAGRKQAEDVVESHLLRFAFREELGPLSWGKTT